MAETVVITGRARVIANINRQVKGFKQRSKLGIRLVLLRVWEKTEPITPRKIGHLRRSIFMRVAGTDDRPRGTIGFRADYAPYVHERQATHAPPTQWKFLEEGLRRTAPEVTRIMAAAVRLKR